MNTSSNAASIMLKSSLHETTVTEERHAATTGTSQEVLHIDVSYLSKHALKHMMLPYAYMYTHTCHQDSSRSTYTAWTCLSGDWAIEAALALTIALCVGTAEGKLALTSLGFIASCGAMHGV